MSLGHFDRLGPVDVPEGKSAILATTDDQAVVPLECETGVFMAFEQPIHTL